MPTVPSYQTQVSPNVAPTVTLQSTAPTAAFGGGIAEAEGKIADDLFKQAVKEKATDDFNAVTTATNQINEQINKDFNGEGGFFTRKGANAKGLTADVDAYFSKTAESFIPKMANDTQRANFASKMADVSFNYKKAVATQERAELDAYATQNLHNTYLLGQETIGKNYRNNEIIDSNIKRLEENVSVERNKEGWDSETYEQQKFSNISPGVVNAVNAAILAEDYERAEVLSYKYQDYLPSKEAASFGATITKNRTANKLIVKNKTLFAQYKDDLPGALAAIEAGATTGGNSESGLKSVEAMRAQLGIKYERGGDGKTSTDCGKSCLVAYQNAGINFDNRFVPYMIDEAKTKGMWHEADGYTPKAGDLAVVNGDDHIVMVTEKGGTIQAGTSQMKVYESDKSPAEMFGNVTGYISPPAEGLSWVEIQKEKDEYISYYNQQKTVIKLVEQQEVASVSNSMLADYTAGNRDPQHYIDIAKQMAGGDYKKLETYLSVAKNVTQLFATAARTKSDMNSMLYFNRIISKANIEDIPTIRAKLYSQSDMFSESDLIGFDKQLNLLANGKDDKAGAIADKNWQSETNSKEIIANTLSVLEAEGVHGTDRYVRAKEILGSGKANNRAIKTYSDTNNKERQAIVDSWGDSGEKVMSLLETGFKRGYNVDGNAFKWNGDYHSVNSFISDIGSAMKTDPVAEESLDYIMSRSLPLNPETYSIVYEKLAGE